MIQMNVEIVNLSTVEFEPVSRFLTVIGEDDIRIEAKRLSDRLKVLLLTALEMFLIRED